MAQGSSDSKDGVVGDRVAGSGTAHDSLGDQIERGRKQSGTRLERGRTVSIDYLAALFTAGSR